MKLCTICARGGSKGVPGKNIRLLDGLPLIAHSIKQARETGLFPLIAVSSDSDDILAAAQAHGADIVIKRPAHLATDESGKVPAIVHAVQTVETLQDRYFDIVVDLDATSPLRLPSDVVESVELQAEYHCSNVITGALAHRSPYFNLVECDEKGVARLSKPLPKGVLRRQDSPACYDMNGSVYVWKRDKLLSDPRVFYEDTRLFAMPRERSLDIDEEIDFVIVEMLMQRRKHALQSS